MAADSNPPTASGSEPELEPDQLPDDDFIDDDLASDPARMTMGMRIVYLLLFVVVAGMVTYLVLIILYPERFAQPSWIGAAPSAKEAAARRKITGFGLGGIVLSMTPAHVKAIYPETRFEPIAGGGLIGTFHHHEGDYQVWFHGPERGQRSYAIRSQHAYPKASYVELLSELGNKFGTPGSSTCGAEAGTVAIRCSVTWEMPDVALDAQIRTAAPPAGATAGTGATTTLTITATDLRPDSMFPKPAAPTSRMPAKPAK